jgi:probable F420-dependent oxidoreductase
LRAADQTAGTRSVAVGVMLPSATRSRDRTGEGAKLAEYASLAEACGFDSVWVGEHLLPSPPVYTGSFIDPLIALSVAGASTSSIELGTCILALPLWHPVRLAKQAATLQALSGGRLALGVGTGYNRPEFDALGVPFRKRGAIVDESVDVLKRLLTETAVSYQGEFFDLEDVSIQPLPETKVPVLVGGGAEAAGSETGAASVMSGRVLQRIARSDGWLSRISSTVEQFESDLRLIRDARPPARESDRFRCVYVNHLHLVPGMPREAACEEQLRAYRKLSGGQRADTLLRRLYLFGTPDEIIEALRSRISAGATEILLSPATRDPEQIRLWGKHLLPELRA